MKDKIIGIILCMLLVSGLTVTAQTINQPSEQTTSMDDDVPIWNVGDSWTYTVTDFTVDYDQGGQKIFVDGTIDDFIWTVESTAGSTYQVEFTGKINCQYDIILSSSTGTLHVTGTMKNTLTSFSGTIVFTKSDLQIRDVSGEIKGITFGKIAPLPFALPLPFKMTVDGDLSQDFPLFDFPLSVPKFWNLPNIEATMRIRVGGLFGLISIPMTFYVEYPYTILAFYCKDQRDISVEAGVFNAYEIESTFFDLFEYYYAPAVGNLIKIDATLTNGDVHAQLKSYNWP